MALKQGSLIRRISDHLRARRDVLLRNQIDQISKTKSSIRILDLGGTEEYWLRVGIDFLRERNVLITLVNLHESELPADSLKHGILTSEVGDACNLPHYADMSYDLVHSNSVIEHVETCANMAKFAAETRRLAPAYYVQTPYFWCPLEPHFYKMPFFHWLPRPLRARLLSALPIAHIGRIKDIGESYNVVDSARLLDGRQFRFLFPDSKTQFEWFMGIPKSLIAIKT
jgi:hypothetical protein